MNDKIEEKGQLDIASDSRDFINQLRDIGFSEFKIGLVYGQLMITCANDNMSNG